jgi:hypothetical protein
VKYVSSQKEQIVTRSAISDLDAQIRSAQKILVGNPGVKRPLTKPEPIWADNIKMDLRDM